MRESGVSCCRPSFRSFRNRALPIRCHACTSRLRRRWVLCRGNCPRRGSLRGSADAVGSTNSAADTRALRHPGSRALFCSKSSMLLAVRRYHHSHTPHLSLGRSHPAGESWAGGGGSMNPPYARCPDQSGQGAAWKKQRRRPHIGGMCKMRRSGKKACDDHHWSVVDDLDCGCAVTAAELDAVEAFLKSKGDPPALPGWQ
jgi:hypothetical protein